MIPEIEKSSHLKGEQCTIYYNIQKNKSVEKSQTGSPDHRQRGLSVKRMLQYGKRAGVLYL